ncbi:MAG: transaldolase [Candidatus Parabeggiatoa sp. nov. 1]|nr:MAG: transaldolase [Gammaproteobacteria bacterium]
MRLFLDTADRNAWRECLSLGLFYGVTTNPIILEKAGITCSLSALHQLAIDAFELGAKEFHAQVWGNSVAEFVTVGQKLAAIYPHKLVVKVPITDIGIKAAKHLALDNIPLTFTGLYSAHQVITAAALGVNYAAPYLGRMDDNNRDGLGEITLMHKMLMGKPTRLLVASLRHINSIVTLAAAGLDTFTISPDVTKQLIDEPLTDKAAADFQAAALRMTEK